MILIILYVLGFFLTIFIGNVVKKTYPHYDKFLLVGTLILIWLLSPVLVLGFLWVTIKTLFKKS